MGYAEFVNSKMAQDSTSAITSGYTLNRALFDYQQMIVKWALRRGRAAIFADCGLGKTLMQLEWARIVAQQSTAPVLILCPLAVAAQTIAEGARFGIDARYLREDDGGAGIIVTNYEMMDRFEAARFAGLVLDESSILKSYDGKTRTRILEVAQAVPYRLACTATPAPNDHMELGNHAQFVGVMSREEMLASYFIHDSSGGTNAWRIKGHGSDAFWRWVATWAVCIRTPADVGCDGTSYVLPSLNINEHIVTTPKAPTDGMLFQLSANTLSELRASQRESAPYRAEVAASIVNAEPGESWVVWVHTNAEADEVMTRLDGAVEVRGSDSPDGKAKTLTAFADGEIRVLVTKPSIAGFGLNWQHCARQCWVGLSHSYESFYQSIRRVWRFGQTRAVDVHVCVADTEQTVLRSIRSKQENADEMSESMTSAMRQTTLDQMTEAASCYSDEYQTATWQDADGKATAHLGDCVEVWRNLDDDSIDFTIFSPPFASLFTYSASPRDMGNVSDDAEFAEHFGYLVPELLRTTRPGRLCAVHCMNLTTTKARDGFIGLRDFRGDIIRAFTSAGWIYHSEVTIWKDPVTSMQRTKAHGLLHATLCKDSARSRQGLPDYLVIFRKPGPATSPVNSGHKAHRFTDYVGTDGPTVDPEMDPRRHSIEVWQRYASPVWFDIDQGRTLNNYRDGREDKDERHICPLQLDVIERAIHLWTNPGDLVATPFMGIGSEVVSAVKMGRRGVGAELKRSYWDLAVSNIKDEIKPKAQVSLFDMLG